MLSNRKTIRLIINYRSEVRNVPGPCKAREETLPGRKMLYCIAIEQALSVTIYLLAFYFVLIGDKIILTDKIMVTYNQTKRW